MKPYLTLRLNNDRIVFKLDINRQWSLPLYIVPLFVMADNVIDEQSQSLMFEQFEQHEVNVIGHGVHEKLHAMIDTWAEIFSVG